MRPRKSAKSRLIGGRYKLESQLSDSANSSVWLATDMVDTQTVVVKLLSSDRFVDDASTKRFKRLNQILAQLDHPNIVSTIDSGFDSDRSQPPVPFVITSLFDAPTLRQLLDKKKVDEQLAVDVAVQTAAALDYAHTNGVLHNDIKPSNILVSCQKSGQITVKLADFGSATLSGVRTTEGTAKYASPERLRALPTDPRSDLYSLGIVFYEMLTGQAPFKGNTEREIAVAQVDQNPTPIREIKPELSQSLQPIVDRLLAKKPSERFSSAVAFQNALLYNHRDVPMPDSPTPTPPGGVAIMSDNPIKSGIPPRLRMPLAIVVFAVFLAVIAIFVAMSASL